MSIELKQAAQQAVDAFHAFGDADDFASLFELTQKMRALRTAIQQAEAQQPVTGEPVAWMHPSGGVLQALLTGLERRTYTIPLYTHPAPIVPTTPEPVMDVRCEGCGYMTHHREHMGCVRAAKQHTRPVPSVPDGYALVPIEPTQAMMNVQTWDFSSFYSPREIWAAMLAAKDSK